MLARVNRNDDARTIPTERLIGSASRPIVAGALKIEGEHGRRHGIGRGDNLDARLHVDPVAEDEARLACQRPMVERDLMDMTVGLGRMGNEEGRTIWRR